ncbi:hypothetical protein BDN70DRAFT_898594 [Pholiota conissans]|uniref:Uncharacterized protein n=1 Tax=Pholiota conissans TaxID=109636 RepID=A0A9P6CPP4_9AGAR|nr:hypothetical protein BDN70DRAFT_898594 [Pholiota conissans]
MNVQALSLNAHDRNNKNEYHGGETIVTTHRLCCRTALIEKQITYRKPILTSTQLDFVKLRDCETSWPKEMHRHCRFGAAQHSVEIQDARYEYQRLNESRPFFGNIFSIVRGTSSERDVRKRCLRSSLGFDHRDQLVVGTGMATRGGFDPWVQRVWQPTGTTEGMVELVVGNLYRWPGESGWRRNRSWSRKDRQMVVEACREGQRNGGGGVLTRCPVAMALLGDLRKVGDGLAQAERWGDGNRYVASRTEDAVERGEEPSAGNIPVERHGVAYEVVVCKAKSSENRGNVARQSDAAW